MSVQCCNKEDKDMKILHKFHLALYKMKQKITGTPVEKMRRGGGQK